MSFYIPKLYLVVSPWLVCVDLIGGFMLFLGWTMNIKVSVFWKIRSPELGVTTWGSICWVILGSLFTVNSRMLICNQVGLMRSTYVGEVEGKL